MDAKKNDEELEETEVELDGDEAFDEDADEIIELIDDDGNVIQFKILDVIKYKGAKYAFLLAAEPDEEFTENDVVIMRINEEKDVLEPIEDEDFLEEVYEYYYSDADDEDTN